MNTKLIGGILLVVGTTIGGGMLALPLATAQAGFTNSLLLLFAVWVVMTLSAFLILEVNLWLPPNSNLVSMAKATLGRWGQIVAWCSYLLLMYALLAAYMAGGGDFLHGLILKLGVKLPASIGSLLFTVALGFIVFFGMRWVDYVNRGLMFSKMGFYLLLVLCIIPFVSVDKLVDGEMRYLTSGITVILTAFGFAVIVPSLRAYFNDDIAKLRKVILIGSLIPLGCYILWDLVIMGVMPAAGLIALLHSNNSTSQFVNSLSEVLNTNTISVISRFFVAVCLATSFLGCALSLSDFLADGLQITKNGRGNYLVHAATFIPPLFMVLFYPGIFVAALSYAGIVCEVLLVLLPVLMVWQGRYRLKIATGYEVSGGKPLLIILLFAGALIVMQGIIENIP